MLLTGRPSAQTLGRLGPTLGDNHRLGIVGLSLVQKGKAGKMGRPLLCRFVRLLPLVPRHLFQRGLTIQVHIAARSILSAPFLSPALQPGPPELYSSATPY